MSNFCKTCKYIRTAEQLGVVSPVTKTDELFCGRYPPQTGAASVRRPDEPTACGRIESLQYDTYTDQPICLPSCNEGQGYRDMACWTATDEDKLTSLSCTVDELAALYELMSAASTGWKLQYAEIYIKYQEALVELRSRP